MEMQIPTLEKEFLLILENTKEKALAFKQELTKIYFFVIITF